VEDVVKDNFSIDLRLHELTGVALGDPWFGSSTV
jgi:hypothetical protein